MKQDDRFFRLMHAVDDDLLEEAMQPVRRRRHVWIPLAAAAGAAAFETVLRLPEASCVLRSIFSADTVCAVSSISFFSAAASAVWMPLMLALP